jgi:hypothetical protein
MSPKKAPGRPESIDSSLATGIQLLNGKLHIQFPSGQTEVEIVKVEPYMHKKTDGYVKKFNAKDRKAGELMVTWSMGNPQIFYVVSPDHQRIVYLREFKIGNVVCTAKALIEKFGLTKAQVEGLDGLQVQNPAVNSIARVELNTSAATESIRRETSGHVNSLGIMTKSK